MKCGGDKTVELWGLKGNVVIEDANGNGKLDFHEAAALPDEKPGKPSPFGFVKSDAGVQERLEAMGITNLKTGVKLGPLQQYAECMTSLGYALDSSLMGFRLGIDTLAELERAKGLAKQAGIPFPEKAEAMIMELRTEKYREMLSSVSMYSSRDCEVQIRKSREYAKSAGVPTDRSLEADFRKKAYGRIMAAARECWVRGDERGMKEAFAEASKIAKIAGIKSFDDDKKSVETMMPAGGRFSWSPPLNDGSKQEMFFEGAKIGFKGIF